ncbi:MAG: DNA double-strand break repair nuclease NurA [Candidatus Bathyarchaeota archaeon]|nr:DNA double-strand break repair nuclease NurA [Candidatus Bathyarchaeota archaeon]
MLAVKQKTINETITKPPAQTNNLTLTLRNLILSEITENVFNETPKINQIAETIRKKMEITPLRKEEDYVQVLGVDAGSQVIPLASMQYAVIGALAYSFPYGRRYFVQPESLSQPYGDSLNNFRSLVDIRREAMLYETAYGYLEHYPDIEVVFIDGPLAFSNWWAKVGEESDRQRLINAINKLIAMCHRLGITVAGVVKRPTARHLVHFLGLEKETDYTDGFIMLHALEAGERTEVFSPKTGLRMATRRSPLMDAVDSPIYSSYLRISKEWQTPPIRLDMPAFCIDELDRVANYCYATSYWSGLPLPIVKADEEVKVTKRFIADVYSEALSRVGRVSGEFSQLAPFWGESGWMGV